jgi:hypothetical protein
MLEKGGVHDSGESTRGRCCTRKKGFAGGGGYKGRVQKGGLRKKVSGEGCSASEFSECESTQEADPQERE